MRTHESQEMYLETILLLRSRKANVRSVDVVEELGYAKSSVSRAVNLLHKSGLIEIDGNGDITLTPAGQKKAGHALSGSPRPAAMGAAAGGAPACDPSFPGTCASGRTPPGPQV